jgi:hypothetical protein
MPRVYQKSGRPVEPAEWETRQLIQFGDTQQLRWDACVSVLSVRVDYRVVSTHYPYSLRYC